MAEQDTVKYCVRCGASVIYAERYGKIRPVCPRCGWIYFADPKVAAGILVFDEARILLVRRAHSPQKGLWTFPAGFVDAGEDPARAAERECLEETGLRVRAEEILDVIAGKAHPHGADFILIYRGILLGGVPAANDDADALAFFSLDELPPLAFPSTREILEKV
jgi:ADP-ribose pyrophosphatase YjhB (NUDIX family)